MKLIAELKASPPQQRLRHAAIRRNIGTMSIIAAAFSGGPFGLAWLASTSFATFLMLIIWQARRQQMNPRRLEQ